jgi:hypothetical protein
LAFVVGQGIGVKIDSKTCENTDFCYDFIIDERSIQPMCGGGIREDGATIFPNTTFQGLLSSYD